MQIERPNDARRDSVPVVCVVDDDVSLLRAIHRLLKVGGFAVCTFSSAEEFLRTPPHRDVACLVLDVHLGGLSGFDLHERLVASGQRIPVLFITARDDAPTRERARLAGAIDYLRKPFDDESLLAAVHRAIEQS
jgi:FixJ family two-component response regulator